MYQQIICYISFNARKNVDRALKRLYSTGVLFILLVHLYVIPHPSTIEMEKYLRTYKPFLLYSKKRERILHKLWIDFFHYMPFLDCQCICMSFHILDFSPIFVSLLFIETYWMNNNIGVSAVYCNKTPYRQYLVFYRAIYRIWKCRYFVFRSNLRLPMEFSYESLTPVDSHSLTFSCGHSFLTDFRIQRDTTTNIMFKK